MKTRARSKQRYVFGLDLSLRATGLCIACGNPDDKLGNTLSVRSKLIGVGEELRGPERLSVITQLIFAWQKEELGQCMGPGDLYVTEGYAFSAQQAHSLGEIGGCVRRVIWESGGNLIVVPPTTLKKFVTGKGSGDKNVIIKHVYKRWAFDVDDDNECDAFGCAMLGLVSLKDEARQTKFEREMLTTKVQRYAGKGQIGWAGEPIKRQRKRRKTKN